MYCLLFLNLHTKKCNQMLDYYSWDTLNKQVRENVKGQEGYCHKEDTFISDAEFLRKGLGSKQKPVLPGFLLDGPFLIQ